MSGEEYCYIKAWLKFPPTGTCLATNARLEQQASSSIASTIETLLPTSTGLGSSNPVPSSSQSVRTGCLSEVLLTVVFGSFSLLLTMEQPMRLLGFPFQERASCAPD